MSALAVLTVSLYTVVFISLATNLYQVLMESKKLKEDGKTPLVGKNLTTVGVAGLAEVLAVTLLVYITSLITADLEIIGVIVVFLSGYLFRNVAAYLAAWGIWTIFVTIDKKKMKEKIDNDQEEAF
jgi:hypothetical protein